MKKTMLTLVTLALVGMSTAYSQVGINTTTPDASSILDVNVTSLPATEKLGFLPPRMTTAQRNTINSGAPAEGLVIYNIDANCLQWWNGSGWHNACDGTINGIIPGNTTCSAATISATPCSAVPGATLNDDPDTADGIEYDWTDATGFVDGGTTQALIEIGGQCWYRRNAVNTPSAYDPVPTWMNNTDVGWSGDFTGGPFTNEGKLYQWSAAMNGNSTERAQGVCPTGWHVPSDCELMYLENTLGMSTADQEITGWRDSGNVGGKLSTLTREMPASANGTGTNSSGFTALLAGARIIDGSFIGRSATGRWWSSSLTEGSTTDAINRTVASSRAGMRRGNFDKAGSFSVRCIKD